jgi:hypothetical protein
MEHPDFLTKYFLRRLAIARRERRYNNRGAEHNEALFELLFFIVLLPVGGLATFAIILSLRWMPGGHAVSNSLPSLYFLGAALTIVCYLIGRRILSARYKRYLQEPVSFLGFNTERDRRIAHRQKALAILTFGVAMPGIAAVIVFWGWVVTHL